MKTILLTGGGTAGHVSPHFALIPKLLQDGWTIHYAGTKDGIERSLIEPLGGVTYHVISSGKLRRYFSVKNFTDPFRVMAGAAQALALVGRLRPSVVFSKGGFVSVPVVAAAGLRGVPVILHESDMTPGLANRMSVRFAKKVCTSFPETAAMIPGGKGEYTGTPLRPELFLGDRSRALTWLSFTDQAPVLLVTGGSLGAQAVNKCLREALPLLLPRFQVVHLCGKGNMDESLSHLKGYRQFEYMKERMADCYAVADVVLSRAGSNTLTELIALRKPALFIPYPRSASRGEQEKNARSMEARGFSRVLLQEDMTPERLACDLMSLYRERAPLIKAMAKVPPDDGTVRVLRLIDEFAKP